MAAHSIPPQPTPDAREFWKPQRPANFRVEKCDGCGNEMVIGSRFCHLCGHERDSQPQVARSSFADIMDWDSIRRRSGLTTPALIFAIVGFGCGLAAILTGILISANTATDWWAVQTWRIEWMVGALVAFAAAMVFKRD